MIAPPLTVNEALWRSARWTIGFGTKRAPSRFRSPSERAGIPSTERLIPVGLRDVSLARDLAICLLAGLAAAACVHGLRFGLRLPGHAILRSTLPVTIGMAFAPRRASGTLIGASALGGSLALQACGMAAAGWGAFTSLLLVGPSLDVALWQTRGGRSIWWRCAAAGWIANMGAFAVRGGIKAAGADTLTRRPLSAWWSTALLSYAACGLAAGLLAAVLCFRTERTRGT